jgi:hypothetical protein
MTDEKPTDETPKVETEKKESILLNWIPILVGFGALTLVGMLLS